MDPAPRHHITSEIQVPFNINICDAFRFFFFFGCGWNTQPIRSSDQCTTLITTQTLEKKIIILVTALLFFFPYRLVHSSIVPTTDRAYRQHLQWPMACDFRGVPGLMLKRQRIGTMNIWALMSKRMASAYKSTSLGGYVRNGKGASSFFFWTRKKITPTYQTLVTW